MSCVGAAIPYGVEYLLYRGSEAFSNYAFGIGSSGDNPTGYIFNSTIFTGYQLGAIQISVSLIILLFGVICGLAYFTKIREKKELVKWMFYLCCLVFFMLFGLAKWHPQWLLMAVPFWVISAFIHKDTKIFMIIDILFMLFFTIFNVTMIPQNVDQQMFNYGIFGGLLNKDIGSKLLMTNIIGKIDPMICLSMLSMIMLVYAVFKHPKYCADDFSANIDCMGWIRARFVIGVAIFVIPAFMCLYASQVGTKPAYKVEENNSGVLISKTQNAVVQQFVSRGTVIDQIQFPIIVNGRINNADLKVTLREQYTGKELYSESMDASKWWDGKLIQIFTGTIPVVKGAMYEVVFEVEPREQECKIALQTNHTISTKDIREKAIINGKEENLQIQMIIYQE